MDAHVPPPVSPDKRLANVILVNPLVAKQRLIGAAATPAFGDAVTVKGTAMMFDLHPLASVICAYTAPPLVEYALGFAIIAVAVALLYHITLPDVLGSISPFNDVKSNVALPLAHCDKPVTALATGDGFTISVTVLVCCGQPTPSPTVYSY